MKKCLSPLYVCAVAIMLTSIVSCKKSEDSGVSSITGEWEARAETFKLTNTGANPPTVIASGTVSFLPGHGSYLSLKSDNTYFYKDSASAPINESGTYTYSSGRLITTPAGSSSGDTSTIVLNSNNFVLSQTERDGAMLGEYTFTFYHP